MAEAMLAVVILSIAAAGVILPFTGGAALETEGSRISLASSLACNLLESIAAKGVTDPDGETPGDMDDADDWDGYTENAGQIKDPIGNTITASEYAAFSRSAVCQWVRMGEQSNLLSPSCVLVTVSVEYKERPIASVSRLISK